MKTESLNHREKHFYYHHIYIYAIHTRIYIGNTLGIAYKTSQHYNLIKVILKKIITLRNLDNSLLESRI